MAKQGKSQRETQQPQTRDRDESAPADRSGRDDAELIDDKATDADEEEFDESDDDSADEEDASEDEF
jgi:hypothetical protein